MHPNPKRIVPLVVLLLVAAGLWWWQGGRATAADGRPRASGTIEAREIVVAAESPGRVASVAVETGDTVSEGQILVTFDDALLQAQRRQAEAALAAAQGQHAAAQAGIAAAEATYALLQAGASDEQLEVATSAVARARAAVDAAEASYDALPEAAQASAQGVQLQQQVEVARATLDNARAQQAQMEAGARPQQLEAAEAQVEAARAQAQAAQGQVQAAEATLALLDLQLERLALRAPLDAVVLERAIEPGEVTMPGGALLHLADLSHLSLTVYVPEEQYGRIQRGEQALVTVDSFPGERFTGTVQRIADHAEFTPRNVQTPEGRASTVYAIELRLDNPTGTLKPGMPADVQFP